VIRVDGKDWGTAAEIAAALGPDIRPATVRRWADRDGLPAVRSTGTDGRPAVRYPLDDAARIEAAKRLGGLGRRRELDIGMTVPP
jgi:hypothetical protein